MVPLFLWAVTGLEGRRPFDFGSLVGSGGSRRFRAAGLGNFFGLGVGSGTRRAIRHRSGLPR